MDSDSINSVRPLQDDGSPNMEEFSSRASGPCPSIKGFAKPARMTVPVLSPATICVVWDGTIKLRDEWEDYVWLAARDYNNFDASGRRGVHPGWTEQDALIEAVRKYGPQYFRR